ncbi:Uncharacterized protein Veg [Clostridium collagenovorans DSM 3089]|uniref:Uncharacterized protein Veg n=1 Tax=Clostridium collagenovorans DSM 3089 TaxID=1121306 RepID=A0A1M5W4S2_9CLOT|nr:Veg family protein [Clostridium collagenovorans]SHH82204.1 Uncharacterized protein Veg [Clostridium collagenovorans DSM 3089]
MIQQAKINSIKNELEKHTGESVSLKDIGGRRKVLIKNGVLEKTYSSIFVVKVEDDYERRVTYSYTDVLTKSVQLSFAQL